MSAICPLKVQKPAKKRNNQFLVSCRKTALLCDFWNISKLCKMRGGIFDSRTGHHQHLLTFGLTKPIVSFLFCPEKAVVRCLSAIVKNYVQSAFFMHPAFLFSENRKLRPLPPQLSPVRSGIDGNIHSKSLTSSNVLTHPKR